MGNENKIQTTKILKGGVKNEKMQCKKKSRKECKKITQMEKQQKKQKI